MANAIGLVQHHGAHTSRERHHQLQSRDQPELCTLFYASHEIKAGRKIVLKVVRQDRDAFSYAAD